MPKFICLYIILSLVLIQVFALTLSNNVFATQPNKIGVGPIELEVPNRYEKSLLVQIEISGGDLGSRVYSWDIRNNRSCSGNPCTDEIQIPVTPAIEPILNAGQSYTIKLKRVVHLSNNQEDPSGQIRCIQNCGTGEAFTYIKQIGQNTGTIKYKWTPPLISTPVLNPTQQAIQRSSYGSVIINNLDSRAKYIITLQKNTTSGQTRIYGQADFTVNNNGCNFTRNTFNPSMTCGSNISPNTPFSLVNGNVLINSSSLPSSTVNETYNLRIKYFDKNEPNPDITGKSQFVNGTITITPDTPAINTLNITLNPSFVLINTDQTIAVSTTGTEAGKKYRFEIETSDTPKTVPDVTAQGPNLSITFQTKQRGVFLYRVGGAYRVSVIDQLDNSKQGSTSLQVDSPTPTPTLPSGPTTPYTPRTEPCDPQTGLAGTGGVPTAIGCVPTDITELITRLFRVILGFSGAAALLLMIAGAFRMITSAGNAESLKKGQEQFRDAIIGLLFTIFSVLLLKVIGVDILGLGGFIGY